MAAVQEVVVQEAVAQTKTVVAVEVRMVVVAAQEGVIVKRPLVNLYSNL